MAHDDAVLMTASDVSAPAPNTAAGITRAADPKAENLLHQIDFGYSATPTGGLMEVKRAGTIVRSITITAAGPLTIYFDPPIKTALNEALDVVLAAGGAGVSGKVNVTTSKRPVHVPNAGI